MKLVVSNAMFISLLIANGGAGTVLSASNNQNVTLHADSSSKCPPGYGKPADQNFAACYKVYKDKMTKKDAASACEAYNGKLASVPNVLVNSYLSSLTREAGTTEIWLGIKCIDSKVEDCVNDDGSKLKYTKFAFTAMSRANDCVYLRNFGSNDGEWTSWDCDRKTSFACEVPVENPPTCPQDYTEFQEKCYKFVSLNKPISGNSASAECRKISGGNLATIADAQVNTFLAIAAKNVITSDPCVATGLRCPNNRQTGDASSCQWDDGTPFVFNSFLRGFPQAGERGCCDFNWGNWDYCHPCDGPQFGAYICQAPKTN